MDDIAPFTLKRGRLRDREGRTAYQFLREMYEYEWCGECGKGARSHVAVGFMGNWLSLCRQSQPTGEEA